ncbi:MAG: hypothetical protein OXE73_13180 [Gammaproteobacteria bacterium]|nr:hypothetical protein [Gammaproteobacteria bacterium]
MTENRSPSAEEIRQIVREEVGKQVIPEAEIRCIIREETGPRFDSLEGRVDAVHRDLLSLRYELRGVIDPDFPPVRAKVHG